jgi:L-arabinokinase
MGKRIIEESTGRTWSWVSELPPEEMTNLPDTLDGASFLDRWGSTDDTVTTVDPHETYPIRAATRFGVEEHDRSNQAAHHIDRGDIGALRPLFAASHAGYDGMGLGHPAATAVVDDALCRPGVHGARSSGGGSGGTVVVVCDKGALDDVDVLIR